MLGNRVRGPCRSCALPTQGNTQKEWDLMKRKVAIFAFDGVCIAAFVALAVLTGESGARTPVPVRRSVVDSAVTLGNPSQGTHPGPPGVRDPHPPEGGGTRIVVGLDEPLVPTAPTSADEDRALDAAIAAFQTAASPDGFPLAGFARFAESYPRSAWRVAVLTNLGLAYYRAGYFGRALDSWQVAWNEGRNARDARAKALVDRAVGELARMHARLGHVDELERLFRDVGSRSLTGPATETITGAREGAWTMRNEPGIAYLCGPSALKNLMIARGAGPDAIALLTQQRSGPRGFSLAQLDSLANRVKLRHRVIHREPGQAIPVPSVVHWKVGHFAAIVGERDGGYLIKDPTFGFGTDELWVHRDAIDSETSGFFLVPADASQDSRWRAATATEASQISGKGYTGMSQAGSTTQSDDTILKQCPVRMGMCGYNAHTMLGSLHLTDIPVGYAPPKGPPVFIQLTYNQREANQPATFGFFNVSPKWTLNFLSYIEDHPSVAGAGVLRYVAGGGSVAYPTNGGRYNAQTGEFGPEAQTQAVLARIPASGPVTSYELRMPDGGKHVFGLADGATTAPRRIFLTQIVDPAGNAVTLHYDNQLRLVSITDATGRDTTFNYETDNPLLVTRITDPFGRAATIRYLPSGQLAAITDVIGITSSVTYDAAGLVNSLTTPYGTTRFSYGESAYNSRFLEIVDPMGFAERLEFVHAAPGILGADPVSPPGVSNSYLTYRNSFYWDKHALPLARPTPDASMDYTKARISHWLHTGGSQTAPTLESTKNPLENRVWRTYPGQYWTYFEGTLDLPSSISRVLDDNVTVQASTATYNRLGKPLTLVDARGRQTVFTYAGNDIDLVTVEQQVARTPAPRLVTLAKFTYNAQHLPLTATDASGQTTTFAYNAAGQVVAVTDPQQHVTSYGYDDVGRLTAITDASGAVVQALTYDAFDRVAARTDTVGHSVAYEYDALNRLTQAVYPDGTSQLYAYDKLDLASVTDRRGKVTTYAYDANRRRTSVTDPLGQVTRFDYYENGVLKAITDPNGHVTSWDVDLQSRPIAKHHADGTIGTVTYEATTSRVASVTDALAQSTLYGYDVDDRITSISYHNAQQPTAAVQFTYDPVFPRLVSMTDGTGQTAFTYNPISLSPMLGANRLRSIDSPAAGSVGTNDTVTYAYDELGRITGKTVNGAPQTVTYDAVGRLATVRNPLDVFTYSYADATSRVTAITSTHGPRLDASYFGPSGDELLQQLTYTPHGSSSPVAQYGYTYDPNHNMLSFARQEIENDAAAANSSASQKPAAGLARHVYPLDITRVIRGVLTCLALVLCCALAIRIGWGAVRASRFLFATRIGAVCYILSCGGAGPELTYTYDDDNRLISASYGSDPAQSVAYAYDPASNITSVTGGSAPATTSYTATNAIVGGTYDVNGSPTALDGASYVWDGAHRLIAATKAGIETDFSYDGLGRIVRIVEKSGSETLSDRAYTWCGAARCLEHDNLQPGSPVSKQYFAEGVIAGADALYYVADHLGSVRQLIDATGRTRAHYSYNAYGAATKLAGDLDSDIGYAGLATTAHAGLNLAVFRAYDSQHQRWLSRDPIGEAGGLNLYGYVGQNPTAAIDLLGLARIFIGGFFDEMSDGPVAQYVNDLKSNHQWGTYDKYFAWDQQDEILAYIGTLPQSEPIDIYGHSYGGDTAAKVTAGACPGRIHSLTTVDPVSYGTPDFDSVLEHTNSWTNINNTGGSSLRPDNAIAGIGGAWNGSGDKPGINYIEAPYSHGSFGSSIDYARRRRR